MKPTAYPLLLTSRQKKNGKYPVKIRVVYQRLYHDYKTGIDMSEEEFNQANSSKPKKEYRSAASKLNELKNKADTIINNLKIFTYQKFESAFYEQGPKGVVLYDIFMEYVAELKKEDRVKTAFSYATAANSFKDFSPKATIFDVDETFLKKYHAYSLGKNKSLSTIGIYVRSLRAVYNYAVARGIIKRNEDYPFARNKYVIPASSNVKKSLSQEEIKKIIDFPTADGSFADRAKDFWLFSYLCNGINFKDISLLKWKNIDGDMIRFVREKTKRTSQANLRTISCYITEEVRQVIKKWGHSEGNSDSFIFPFITDNDSPEVRQKKIDQFIQNTNKNLKRICKAQGIEKPVTTYYCRHTAATVLKRGGASILQIQEALGHSSSLVTQRYLDSFEDESKKELSLTLAKTLINGK